MDEAYGPSFAFIATFLFLNLFQCAFGLRRIRMLERRIQLLENNETSAPPTTQTQAQGQTTVSTYTNPNYTYAAPPTTVLSYYQQPSAPPQAQQYYPQDPQVITGRIY